MKSITLTPEQRKEIERRRKESLDRRIYQRLTAIRKSLGYKPQVDFTDGLRELVDWANSTEAKDTFDQANRELAKRGLV